MVWRTLPPENRNLPHFKDTVTFHLDRISILAIGDRGQTVLSLSLAIDYRREEFTSAVLVFASRAVSLGADPG